MMEFWNDFSVLLGGGLQAHAAPWAIAFALVLTTFLLEDVAIAAGAALATQGTITWPIAFGAVAGGIALGDLGLYALGIGARRLPWLHRKYIAGKPTSIKHNLESKMLSVVLLARVIPGLRLVTYTLCGFAKIQLLQFVVAIAFAVTAWTAGLFWLSSTIGTTISERLHISAPLAVALPIIVVALAVPAIRWIRSHRTKTSV